MSGTSAAQHARSTRAHDFPKDYENARADSQKLPLLCAGVLMKDTFFGESGLWGSPPHGTQAQTDSPGPGLQTVIAEVALS